MAPGCDSKLLRIFFTFPAIVKIADCSEKIKKFSEVTNELIEEVTCGALMANEKATAIYYQSNKH